MNRQDIADELEEVRTKIAEQGKGRECIWLRNFEYALEQQLIDLDKSNNQQEQ